MSEENYEPIDPSNDLEDSTPLPESEDADVALSRQKSLEQLERSATDSIFGGLIGTLPAPEPASDVGPSYDQNQYTNDAFYPNDTILESDVDADLPSAPDNPENALKRPMWEILYKIEDGQKTYTIEPGVIFWNKHKYEVDDELTEKLPIAATPIKYEGGEVPDGGDYIYAFVPVAPVEIDDVVYYEYAGGGVTIMARDEAPADLDYEDGSFPVPIGRIERNSATDPDTGDEIPGSGEITQYLEGAANFDVAFAKSDSTHPWKATSNNNSFITIAAGEVFELNTSSFFPVNWTPISYLGGSIDCSGHGAGDYYILIDIQTTDLAAGSTKAGDSFILTVPSSISVVFSTGIDGGGFTSGNMVFPICEINVNAAGTATVTKQLLTHNPHLHVPSLSPAP